MDIQNLSLKIRLWLQNRNQVMITALLLVILALGAFLRFYQLGQAGMNDYYAAAVKSMLVSWKNFFFVAFEPGGSVSLDKPPLGFWIEALSAHFLGVNGFALALPNALAGVLSIFLVYTLIRRPFGSWAGLAAAVTLAVMPVAIATERNNTIDGMLMCVLLLAAWAFLQSVYTGRVRWLFLGAFIVGLGFNIKMLQAFLPLPAFYALYYFGTNETWLKKALYLTAATALLLAVSFSWAIAVDLTPAANRPYVDSTSGNSMMELIFGHNGLERLTRSGGGPGMLGANDSQGGFPGGHNMPAGNPPAFPQGHGFTPPSAGDGGQFGPRNNGGQPGGGMDFGSAGTLRLFTKPLVGEASWLLPFALGGLIVLGIALWKRSFDEVHASVILWVGWLLPEMLYFTYSLGLMHAYYLIMVCAPIAALVGMTPWALWQIMQKNHLAGWALALLLTGGTLVFETYALLGNTSLDVLALEIAGVLFSLGLLMVVTQVPRKRFSSATLGLLLAAMLVAPAVWSGLTTFNTSPSGLPAAGPAGGRQAMPDGISRTADGGSSMIFPVNLGGRSPAGRPFGGGPGGGVDQNLLDYLISNTKPGTYLLATGRADSAAGYILATGRPVLALGGFLDQYDEVSVDQFSSLVSSGQLRFVLGDAIGRHQAIAQWVRQNCSVVDTSAYASTTVTVLNDLNDSTQNASLYQCGG